MESITQDCRRALMLKYLGEVPLFQKHSLENNEFLDKTVGKNANKKAQSPDNKKVLPNSTHSNLNTEKKKNVTKSISNNKSSSCSSNFSPSSSSLSESSHPLSSTVKPIKKSSSSAFNCGNCDRCIPSSLNWLKVYKFEKDSNKDLGFMIKGKFRRKRGDWMNKMEEDEIGTEEDVLTCGFPLRKRYKISEENDWFDNDYDDVFDEPKKKNQNVNKVFFQTATSLKMKSQSNSSKSNKNSSFRLASTFEKTPIISKPKEKSKIKEENDFDKFIARLDKIAEIEEAETEHKQSLNERLFKSLYEEEDDYNNYDDSKNDPIFSSNNISHSYFTPSQSISSSTTPHQNSRFHTYNSPSSSETTKLSKNTISNYPVPKVSSQPLNFSILDLLEDMKKDPVMFS
jgi:hypothetical protein